MTRKMLAPLHDKTVEHDTSSEPTKRVALPPDIRAYLKSTKGQRKISGDPERSPAVPQRTLTYLDAKNAQQLVAEHCMHLSKELAELLPSKERVGVDPQKEAADNLMALFGAHGVSFEFISTYVERASIGVPFDVKMAEVWRRISHPTLMDFPSDFSRWAFNKTLVQQTLAFTSERFIVSDRTLGLIVKAIPPSQLRKIVLKLGITGTNLATDYSDKLHGILMEMELDGMQRIEMPDLPEGTDSGHHDIIDQVEKSGVSFAYARNGDLSKREILEQTALSYNTVRPSEIEELLTVKSEEIRHCREVGLALRKRKKEPYYFVTPITIFDLLYEKDPKYQITDPILYAWVQKLSHDAKLVGGKKPIGLVQAWRQAPRSRHKPKKDAVVLRILEVITKKRLPIYCIEDLVGPITPIGLPMEEVKTRATLLDILFSREETVRRMWRKDKKNNQFVPSSELESWSKLLRLSSAHHLLPPTDIRQFGEVPTLSPRTLPSGPSRSKVVNLMSDCDQSTAIKDAVFLALGPSPQTKDQKYEHEQQRLIQLFHSSFVNPSGAIGENGMPSLPHLWLLWAVFPETKSMATSMMLDVFCEKWKVHSNPETGLRGTLKRTFVMAAVSVMRGTGQLFASYQDFFSDTVSKITPGKPATSVPNFNRVVALDERREWNPSDRRVTAEMLGWFTTHLEIVPYLGNERPLKKFIKRLKCFAQSSV